MQENNIWLVNSKKTQGITLFQSIAASKDNTLLQNITTADQRTPNKQFYFFLFS